MVTATAVTSSLPSDTLKTVPVYIPGFLLELALAQEEPVSSLRLLLQSLVDIYFYSFAHV